MENSNRDYAGRISAYSIARSDPAVALIERSDGTVIEVPLDSSPFDRSSMITSVRFDIEERSLKLITIRDHEIIQKLPDSQGISNRNDKIAVYLDQNQWSTLAGVTRQGSTKQDSEAKACEDLARLAFTDQLILPLSFAHVSETRQWYDAPKRYQLALTQTKLSKGWILRHPAEVRQLEVRRSFEKLYATECLLPLEVLTLHASAITSDRTAIGSRLTTLPNLPVSLMADHMHILNCSVNVDTLMDSEPEIREHNPNWVRKNTDFQKWVGDNLKESQQRRKATRMFFLVDVRTEVARAATRANLSTQQLEDWLLKRANTELQEMPALGMFGEALHDKTVNAKAKWEDNDLVDLFYLTCAAGYCDKIVCEKETAGVLRQGAQRLKRPLKVYSSIEELMHDQDMARLASLLPPIPTQ